MPFDFLKNEILNTFQSTWYTSSKVIDIEILKLILLI